MPTANIKQTPKRVLELYKGWLKETLCSLVTKPCGKQGSQHTPHLNLCPVTGASSACAAAVELGASISYIHVLLFDLV